MADACRSGDRNPRCVEPPIEGQKFCLGHQAVLDSVKANMRKKDRPASIRKAAPAPPPVKLDTVCRVDKCERSPREAQTTCYRHRGVPDGVNVVVDGCAVEGCGRKATSLSGRCKAHPLKLDGVAVAA